MPAFRLEVFNTRSQRSVKATETIANLDGIVAGDVKGDIAILVGIIHMTLH